MTSKVTIICRNPGMYRNGVPHAARAVYEPGRWTSEQLQNFRNDPAFEVVEGEDLTEVMSSLSNENAAYASALGELTTKLEAVKAERDELVKQVDNAKTLIGKLESEIADAKSATEAVKAELEKLKATAAKPADEKPSAKR